MSRLWSPVLGLMAAGCPVVAHAQNGEQAIDPQAAIAAICAKQSQFSQLDAEFDLLVVGVPARNGEIADSIERCAATGAMTWCRNGELEKLALRFPELPDRFKRDPFLDRTFYLDGTRQVESFFPWRQQVLINDSRAMWMTPTPSQIFFFGLGRGLGEVLEDGASASVESDGEFVRLHVDVPWVGDGAAIDALADPLLDFAMVHWARGDVEQSATIEWTRNSDGDVVPTQATWTEGPEANPQRWTLSVREFKFAPPERRELTFRFEPGMVVTDYFAGKKGKPAYYRIDAKGEAEEIHPLDLTPHEVSSAARISIGGVALALAGAASWRRMRFTTR